MEALQSHRTNSRVLTKSGFAVAVCVWKGGMTQLLAYFTCALASLNDACSLPFAGREKSKILVLSL